MPTFRYKVRDREGQIVTGIQDAASKEVLTAGLRTGGLTPLAIQVVQEERPSAEKSPAHVSNVHGKKSAYPKLPSRVSGRIKDDDLLMFTRELESVVRSGVPILSGLRALGNQSENSVMRKTLQAIASDIEAGIKLSESLAKHPKIFPPVYVSSVLAGETAGQLPAVLNRLGALLERQIETKATVLTATRYPMIVLIALVIGFAVIVNVVLPKFADFYTQLNAPLPLPTRILIKLGRTVHDYWLIVLIMMSSTVFSFFWYIRTPVGRFWWDSVKLKFPVFGPLLLKIALAKFATTLETLYVSGVPIEKAYDITALVVDNTVVARALLKVKQGIIAGEQMAATMQKDRMFPPLVVQMIATGEQTGNLDQHLRDIAEHYNQQVKYITKNLTTLIEPMLTVILGLMVLVFALAVFMPMWNVYKLIGK